MITYEVKVTGMDVIQKGLEKAPSVVVNEVGKAVDKSRITIWGEALRQAPVNKNHGGGNLRQNIKSRMTSKLSAVVESLAPYAAAVEEGTRPHTIQVRNARVLATSARNAPNWPVVSKKGLAIFGKSVNHPGFKGRFYMKKSVEKTKLQVDAFFREAIIKVTKAITNGG